MVFKYSKRVEKQLLGHVYSNSNSYSWTYNVPLPIEKVFQDFFSKNRKLE